VRRDGINVGPQTHFDDDVLEVLEVVALVVEDDVVLSGMSEYPNVYQIVNRKLTWTKMGSKTSWSYGVVSAYSTDGIVDHRTMDPGKDHKDP